MFMKMTGDNIHSPNTLDKCSLGTVENMIEKVLLFKELTFQYFLKYFLIMKYSVQLFGVGYFIIFF